MEKIRNVGWFITDEEMQKIERAYEILQSLIPRTQLTSNDGAALKVDDGSAEIGIRHRCDDCPFAQKGGWTVGDAGWWKNYPFITTSTDENPDCVKDSNTTDGFQWRRDKK